MKDLSEKSKVLGNSIFGTISALSLEYGAVNLGQGFPDFDGPEWLIKEATAQIQKGNNQYAPFPGTINLRKAVSGYYHRIYQLNYDALTQVTITHGATEAIYLAITALVNPGDEVILFEPFYDSYVASVRMAGGIAKAVTIDLKSGTFDRQSLLEAVTDKTKLIIVNNPQNPVGKVYSHDELSFIANIAKKNNAYVLSDEVYEFMTFRESKHIPMASLPDMYDRTITISSAGKTFGVTGWKIGWIAANIQITDLCRKIHQYVSFSVSGPMQETMAVALNNVENYLPEFRSIYEGKYNYFYPALCDIWPVSIPPVDGTYFLMVPIDGVSQLDDIEFAMKLIKEAGVATVPPSSFYLRSNQGKRYLRFCFAKKEETLNQALHRLRNFFTKLEA